MTPERSAALARGRRRGTRANTLFGVVGWEIRRLAATGTGWLSGAGAFGFFAVLVLLRHRWGLSEAYPIIGTSSFGQLNVLVDNLMLVCGMILPFVATDGVPRDYQQRMHELLMTTRLPSWAYVWGRWLAALLAGLGVALALLIAQLTANAGLTLLFGETPAADPHVTLYLWSVITLPVTVMVCSICFGLGALFPRFSIVTKLLAVAAWVVLALDTDPRDLGWHIYWNPTSAGLATLLTTRLRGDVQATLLGITDTTRQVAIAIRLQQQTPDLTPWLGPYVALAAAGVLLVALAGIGFRRFRDVLG